MIEQGNIQQSPINRNAIYTPDIFGPDMGLVKGKNMTKIDRHKWIGHHIAQKSLERKAV